MTEDEEYMLDELLDIEQGLTQWELDFIDNLDNKWRRLDLTQKQTATLRKIYEKATEV